MDLSELIELELRRDRKVELVLTEDAYEGECLAIRFENGKEFLVAWEAFEGCNPDEFEIRKRRVSK
mgnify:CR=1 FL=1